MDPIALNVLNRFSSVIERKQDAWAGTSDVSRLSATGSCLRQQYYTSTGAPSDRISALGMYEMEDGHIHELDVVTQLLQAGYEVQHAGDDQLSIELRLPSGKRVPGHPDGIISGLDFMVPHLLEVKAMSATRFIDCYKQMEKHCYDDEGRWLGPETNGLGLKNAHYSYWLQMQAYMHVLDLKAGFIVCKAKDSSIVRQRLRKGSAIRDAKLYMEIIPYDPEGVEEVIERHETVVEAIEAGLPPAREYDRNKDWQCRYCRFAGICYSDADLRMAA